MSSLFRSRTAAAAAKRPKQKSKAGESRETTADVFRDDPELQQLNAETAELLRLVKSPAPAQIKGTSSSSGAGGVSPARNRKRRVTIEVLDVAEEGGAENADTDGEAKAMRLSPPTGIAAGGAAGGSDPFNFAAEEARVRKAADTFYPDLSPSKGKLAGQQDAFEKEQARLQALARREEEAQTRRRAALTEGFTASNRLEMNAVKVSGAFSLSCLGIHQTYTRCLSVMASRRSKHGVVAICLERSTMSSSASALPISPPTAATEPINSAPRQIPHPVVLATTSGVRSVMSREVRRGTTIPTRGRASGSDLQTSCHHDQPVHSHCPIFTNVDSATAVLAPKAFQPTATTLMDARQRSGWTPRTPCRHCHRLPARARVRDRWRMNLRGAWHRPPIVISPRP